SDGILRRFSATKQSGDRALTALAIEAASLAKPMAVPVGRSIAPAFRTPPRAIPQVSAVDLLLPGHVGRASARPDGLKPVLHLSGKIVFIGLTAVALGDRVLTPVSRDAEAGVTVQAASAESVIRGEEIRDIAPIISGLLATAIVWFVVHPARPRRVIAAMLVTALGVLLLATRGVAIPFVTIVLLIAIIETIDLARSLRFTRAAFTAHRVQ